MIAFFDRASLSSDEAVWGKIGQGTPELSTVMSLSSICVNYKLYSSRFLCLPNLRMSVTDKGRQMYQGADQLGSGCGAQRNGSGLAGK